MPAVTPNRTNHLRQNATFRGTRANSYATPAIEKSNRTKKRKLINRARAGLRDPDLQAAAETLVSVKRRWAKVGNPGAEHEEKLKKELENIYEAFRGRYEGVRARAIARRAKAPAPLTTKPAPLTAKPAPPTNAASPAPPASHPTKGSNE